MGHSVVSVEIGWVGKGEAGFKEKVKSVGISKSIILENEDLVTPVKSSLNNRRNRKGKQKDQDRLDKHSGHNSNL